MTLTRSQLAPRTSHSYPDVYPGAFCAAFPIAPPAACELKLKLHQGSAERNATATPQLRSYFWRFNLVYVRSPPYSHVYLFFLFYG